MQKRFNSLTGIRAIAASMVFLYHNRKYWRADIPEFVLKNLNEFHTGVTLFFVLSGFLIAYTYKDEPLKDKKEYLKYLLIRLVRIFPVYLLLLGIQYIHWGIPKSSNGFINFTLLKGLSDVHNLDGIPQSWSLTVELCFYILAPIIYFLSQKNILKTILLLCLLALLVIGIGYSWHWLNGNKSRWFYDWYFILDATFFGRFSEFFAGILLADLLNKKPEWLNKLKLHSFTLLGLVLSFLCIYCISLFEKNIYSHGTAVWQGLILRNIILPVCFIVWLYGLINEPTILSRFLGNKLLILLGNASYVFYLIHIGYLNQLITPKLLLPDRNFILLWIISIFIYLIIEKPVYNFCRAKIKIW